MYGSSSRNSSLPMVTFICGLMLLAALLNSTDVFEKLRGVRSGCSAGNGRLSLALNLEETTDASCADTRRNNF